MTALPTPGVWWTQHSIDGAIIPGARLVRVATVGDLPGGAGLWRVGTPPAPWATLRGAMSFEHRLERLLDQNGLHVEQVSSRSEGEGTIWIDLEVPVYVPVGESDLERKAASDRATLDSIRDNMPAGAGVL